MDTADLLRMLALLLWATSTILTVAVVLTYNEARRRAGIPIKFLINHVIVIGTGHVVALSTLTYAVFDRIGEEINYMLPAAIYANATSVFALMWVLQYQLTRRRNRSEEAVSDVIE